MLERERRIAEAQAKEPASPRTSIAKIVEGKIEAFFKDNVLLDQPFVKDDSKTIQQLLDEVGGQARGEGCRPPVRSVQAGRGAESS